MVRTPRSWTQFLLLVGALVALVVVLLGLAWLVRRGDLDRVEKIASVIGVVIALVGLVVSVAALRFQLRQLPPRNHDDTAPCDHDDTKPGCRAAQALATAVQRQHDEDFRRLGLQTQARLQVTWSTTTRPVAAPAWTVVGDAVTGQATRLRLHGHLGDVAEKFRALPKRRWVVLGDPGAGKTVLAMALTLGLLARRPPCDPVPVLLRLSSWDPAEHLHAWLARRLREDYLWDGGGKTPAQQLVAKGLILPVLDGLDELPPSRHAEVIRRLNDDWAPTSHAGAPLVVTCRSDEYQEAVRGGPLAAAAVVELERVAAAVAVDYLRTAAAPPGESWDPVAAELEASPDGALAGALSSPLMVALARDVYAAADRHPEELVGVATAGGREAVERHLLDGFISARYANLPPTPGVPAPTLRRPPDPQRARAWLTLLARDLHRHHIDTLAWWQLPRLALGRTVGLVAGLAVGLVFGLIDWTSSGLAHSFSLGLSFGFAFGVGFGVADRRAGRIAVGVVVVLLFVWLEAAIARAGTAITSGLGVGLLVGFAAGLVGRKAEPARVALPVVSLAGLSVRGVARFAREVAVRFVLGVARAVVLVAVFVAVVGVAFASGVLDEDVLGFWVAAGLVLVVVGWGVFAAVGLTRGVARGFVVIAALGVGGGAVVVVASIVGSVVGSESVVVLASIVGGGAGIVFVAGGAAVLTGAVVVMPVRGIAREFQRPVDVSQATTPASVLRSSRTVAVAVAVAVGAAVGVPSLIASGAPLGLASVWHTLAVGLLFGLPVALSGTAWGRFTVVRIWLAAHGRLPWRLMAFLEDARHRGVLRQAGAVYQFRHTELQTHLAATPR